MISNVELTYMVLRKVRSVLDAILFLVKSLFRDMYYKPIDMLVLREYLKMWINGELVKLEYAPDVFDCDDYACYFKAWLTLKSGKNCVGEAIGEIVLPTGEKGLHEWNVVLVRNGGNRVEVMFVEPQTGELFEKETCENIKYKLKWVLW